MHSLEISYLVDGELKTVRVTRAEDNTPVVELINAAMHDLMTELGELYD